MKDFVVHYVANDGHLEAVLNTSHMGASVASKVCRLTWRREVNGLTSALRSSISSLKPTREAIGAVQRA
jgi:hypothetical protein